MSRRSADPGAVNLRALPPVPANAGGGQGAAAGRTPVVLSRMRVAWTAVARMAFARTAVNTGLRPHGAARGVSAHGFTCLPPLIFLAAAISVMAGPIFRTGGASVCRQGAGFAAEFDEFFVGLFLPRMTGKNRWSAAWAWLCRGAAGRRRLNIVQAVSTRSQSGTEVMHGASRRGLEWRYCAVHNNQGEKHEPATRLYRPANRIDVLRRFHRLPDGNQGTGRRAGLLCCGTALRSARRAACRRHHPTVTATFPASRTASRLPGEMPDLTCLRPK